MLCNAHQVTFLKKLEKTENDIRFLVIGSSDVIFAILKIFVLNV